jgi:Polyketide cyclase / dehydrase and lipid transport
LVGSITARSLEFPARSRQQKLLWPLAGLLAIVPSSYMPTVTETTQIDLAADRLWKKAGSFGAVGEWHPMLAKVESSGDHPGALREVETKNGEKLVERLEAFEASRRLYRYSIQSTAMPIRNYAGEFRIDDADHRGSNVIWSVSFDVTSGNKKERQSGNF